MIQANLCIPHKTIICFTETCFWNASKKIFKMMYLGMGEDLGTQSDSVSTWF